MDWLWCERAQSRITPGLISRHWPFLNKPVFTAGCCWLTPVIFATWEAEIRRIECLLCKSEALSSNSSSTKINKIIGFNQILCFEPVLLLWLKNG
jgi:hypothetical protein